MSMSDHDGKYKAFEADWVACRQGLRSEPQVVDYLPDDPVERREVLPWLLKLHFEFHHQAGSNTLLAQGFFKGFSELREDQELALDLIVEQWKILVSIHRNPDLADYVDHFPDYKKVLEHRITSLSLPPRYQFIEEIARGGMGVILRVRDTAIDRPLALKLMLPEADGDRFLAEARTTGQLQHPGIPAVHEIGQLEDGRPFFSMKLVEGHTLHELLRSRPSPQTDLPRYLKIFEQMAQTVAYAHSRGVIHRDLKPLNVMVGAFGEVQVMDWGLAKSRRGAIPISTIGPAAAPETDGHFALRTWPGTILGTPSFMAPEQARGRVEEMDERTDVFSLGAILCVILTGQAPYTGDAREAHRKAEQADLAEAFGRLDLSGADAELIALTKYCLNEDREHRPSTADHVAQGVAGYQAAVQERLRQAELERTAAEARALEEKRTRVAEEQARREAEARAEAEKGLRKRTIALAGTVAAVMAIAGIGSAIYWLKLKQDQRQVETMAAEADDSLARGAPAEARTRANTAKAIIGGHWGFDELKKRLDRQLVRAGARLRLDEFLRTSSEAEYHLLGRSLLFAPKQQPESGRGFVRLYERGPNLKTGIDLGAQALALYGLPEELSSIRELKDLEITGNEANAIRDRATNLLALVALALHQQGEELPPSEQQEPWRRAGLCFNAAESLGLHSRFLYEQRASLRQALGEKASSVKDREMAKTAPADLFLDYRWEAAEAGRAGDWPKAFAAWRTAVALHPGDYWGLFRLAYALQQKGDSEAAREVLLSCKGLRPKDPTAFNESGTILANLNLWPEAVADFREALVLDPDYSIAYGNLIHAYGMMGRVQDAEAVFRDYFTRAPKKPLEIAVVHTNLGMAYDRNGDHDRALSEFTEAIELDPDHLLAYRNRSITYRELNHYEEAEKDARKAVELSPDDAELWYVLGYLYDIWERFPDALQAYSRAIKNDPRMLIAYQQRCVIHRHLGQLDEALEDADRVLELKPSDEDLYVRAMIHAAMKNYKAALNDLNILILGASKPDVRWVRMRGEMWGRLGDGKESEADLSQAVILDGKDPVTRRNRAVTRMKLEEWEPAIADFHAYLKLSPDAEDAAGIHNDIGSAYLELGRDREALAELSLAISAEPIPEAYLNRGKIFLRLSQLQKALDDFSTAVKLAPEEAAGWALRGQARLRLGDFSDAEKDLTEALHRSPGNTETLASLAVALYAQGKVKEARELLNLVATRSSSSARRRFARGMLAHMENRPAGAISELSQALDDQVLRPLALELRARSWLDVGGEGIQAALADADALASLLSKQGFALLQAARIYALAVKRLDPADAAPLSARAVKLLDDAVKLAPGLRKRLVTDADFDSLRKSPGFPGPEERSDEEPRTQ